MAGLRHAAPPNVRPPAGAAGPFSLLDRKLYARGKDVFREGQLGRSAFLIESGTLEIWKKLGDGRVVLGEVGPGGIVGEMALIDDAPRMATATAREATVCVVIPETTLSRRLAEADPFVRALMRIMVRNIRSLTRDKMAGAAMGAGVEPHLID